MLECFYCEGEAKFKLICCEKQGKQIYLCKPCLQQNWRGMKYDPYRPKQCNICKNYPQVKLI
jgi:hypothetical protein